MAGIIISILASIISGMVLFFLQRYFKRKEKQDAAREGREAKKTALMFKSIRALGDLTVANSIALRDGKTNGEMHKALDDYERTDKEVYDFLISNE